MTLERVPGEPQPEGAPPPLALAVPASAVLSTGSHQLVYVERSPGVYESVEPKLGPRAGDYYLVLSGLSAGQRVVTSGGFSPSLGKPIAMGFVPPALAEAGAKLKVIVRGKAQAAEVTAMPFVPHRYVRKL